MQLRLALQRRTDGRVSCRQRGRAVGPVDIRAGRAEGRYGRQAFGPRTQPAFLPAAVQQRNHRQPFADEQRRRALDSADLVRGKRRRVRAAGDHRRLRRRQLAEGLYRVDVQQRARTVLLQQRTDTPDVVQRAGFVVALHHRDDGLAAVERVLERSVIGDAAPAGEPHHLAPRLLKRAQRLVDRRMLALGGDDAPGTPAGRVGMQGDVVRLGAGGGKDNLLRRAARQRRDGRPRVLQHPPRTRPRAVRRGGVAELVERRLQRAPRRGAHRRRGGIVQINLPCHIVFAFALRKLPPFEMQTVRLSGGKDLSCRYPPEFREPQKP